MKTAEKKQVRIARRKAWCARKRKEKVAEFWEAKKTLLPAERLQRGFRIRKRTIRQFADGSIARETFQKLVDRMGLSTVSQLLNPPKPALNLEPAADASQE